MGSRTSLAKCAGTDRDGNNSTSSAEVPKIREVCSGLIFISGCNPHLEDLMVVVAEKGGVAAEQDVNDDSKTPYVRGLAVVLR